MLSVNQVTGEMFLYGVVGKYYYEDYFTSLEVISALASLGGKRAIVHVNSPGGLADEGIAIYGALKRHHPGVDTHIDALAASAASVIALAGENRVTALGARWMIHQSMSWAEGNVSAFEKAISQCQAYDKSLMEIYSQYMPDGTDVMSLMQAETWYTGPESLDVGFSTATGEATNAKPAIASWFRNTPKALVQQSFSDRQSASLKTMRARTVDIAKRIA